MAAVWVRARAEMRARWRGSVAVALLIGLAGGIALAAFAAARRTESAYPRFLDVQNASDVITGSGDVARAVGIEPVPLEQLRALPQIATHDTVSVFIVGAVAEDGRRLFDLGAWASYGAQGPTTLDRPRAIDGRLPDPDAPDEVAVGFETARRLGIAVGDTIGFEFIDRAALAGPESPFNAAPYGPVRARVVGTYASPGAFPPNPAYLAFRLSDAFTRRLEPVAASMIGSIIELRPGVTLSAFKSELDRLAGGGELFQTNDELSRTIQRSIRVEANTFRLFGLIAALAGWFVLAQALARHLHADASERPALRALGMRPGQLLAVALIRSLVVSVAGALVAVVLASASSLATPFGIAGVAEPAPGLLLDPVLMAVGGGALVGGMMLVALLTAWRSAGARPAADGSDARRTRPSLVAQTIASGGVPPSVVTGVRMALEAGRGRTAVPVRSAIAGVAVAMAALVAAFGIGASADRLLETPRLYGLDWSTTFGNPYTPAVGEQMRPALEERDEVVALSAGTPIARIQLVNGARRLAVSAFAFDLVRGRAHPTMISGRWPQDDDEIVLGTKVMRDLALDESGTVEVQVGDQTRRMRIVGRAVFPSFGDANIGELGDAAGMTFQSLRRLVPGVTPSLLLVRLALGADQGRLAADMRAQFGDFATAEFRPSRPSDLSGFARVGSLPVALAGVLGLLAAGTLVHALLTSIRRRRRELAILRSMGFVPRQVRAAVLWQSITLTVASLAIGVPLGLIAGRTLWSVVADHVGVVSEPAVSIPATLLILPGAVLLALLAALVPARRAGRSRVAGDLRMVE